MSGSERLPHDWYPVALPSNVVVGEGSWLHSSFAFLHFGSRRPIAVRIGRACGVYRGCFFDLGPAGEVAVGDFSTLVSVIIATNGRVSIGSYCFIAHEVVIADSHAASPPRPCDDASGRVPAAGELSVSLGDDVWVGAGAVLLRGAHLGNGAVIGAGTVVDFQVPEYAVVAGNPARVVGNTKGGELPPFARDARSA